MAIYDHNQGFDNKRGKRESADSFAAFTVYLELGRERSLKAVASIIGTSVGNVANMSKKYAWSGRAAAYDADQVKATFAEVRKEREAAHRVAIRRFRDDQERRAKALGQLGDLMLDVATEKILAMRAAGEHISEQALSNVARTVASLHEMSANLQATALGIDELESALDQELDK